MPSKDSPAAEALPCALQPCVKSAQCTLHKPNQIAWSTRLQVNSPELEVTTHRRCRTRRRNHPILLARIQDLFSKSADPSTTPAASPEQTGNSRLKTPMNSLLSLWEGERPRWPSLQ